jgi:hypothetical protein
MAFALLCGDGELPRIQWYPRGRSGRKDWEVIGEILAWLVSRFRPWNPRVNIFIGTSYNDQPGSNLNVALCRGCGQGGSGSRHLHRRLNRLPVELGSGSGPG